jgi:hypothetical protein
MTNQPEAPAPLKLCDELGPGEARGTFSFDTDGRPQMSLDGRHYYLRPGQLEHIATRLASMVESGDRGRFVLWTCDFTHEFETANRPLSDVVA